MASDPKETRRSEHIDAIEEVFEFYYDSEDELNTDEEEDGNFYDGYLDERNLSRSLTPSPNVDDDEFLDDSDEKLECVDSVAFPTPAQLEERLRSIQSTKRSRSNTVTLQNMYVREHSSDSDLPESDEEAQYHDQSSGDSEWEL